MLGRILAEARVPPPSWSSRHLELRGDRHPPRPCLTLRTPRQNWGTRPTSCWPSWSSTTAGACIPAGPDHPAGRLDRARPGHPPRSPRPRPQADIQLFELGFREAKDPRVDPGTMELPAKRLAQVTKDLVQAGWRVEAEGKLIRPAGEFKLAVTTGIDWFELGGQVDFGGQAVRLPDLLAAARRGETMVTLGDGSMGMLPEDWLKKYGMLADLGHRRENGHVRFGSAQAGLLDALLAAQPEIQVDVALRQGPRVAPQVRGDPAARGPGRASTASSGPIRARAWAGSTTSRSSTSAASSPTTWAWARPIQVLALLQRRRSRRLAKGPIAGRRAPVARLQLGRRRPSSSPRGSGCSTTPGRTATRSARSSRDHDLIITTYGTLRTDIVELSQIDVRLRDPGRGPGDQERRQPGGQGRAAAQGPAPPGHERHADREPPGRALVDLRVPQPRHARHRPGLQEAHHRRRQPPRTRTAPLLARALRPFILRRTKAQVVKDLPEKSEQTLHCDMEPAQRQLYEELKAHYRQALLRKDAAELNRSKIEVLEALLRLRQAACHPGLIDPTAPASPAPSSTCSCPQTQPRSSRKGTRSWSSRSSPASWPSSATGSTRRA